MGFGEPLTRNLPSAYSLWLSEPVRLTKDFLNTTLSAGVGRLRVYQGLWVSAREVNCCALWGEAEVREGPGVPD